MDVRRYYVVEPVSPGAIDELSDIRLAEAVVSDELGTIPKGARGTVVAVHGNGEAYSVEFVEPFHALLLLRTDQVEAVPGATREHLITSADAVRHRSAED